MTASHFLVSQIEGDNHRGKRVGTVGGMKSREEMGGKKRLRLSL